MSTLPPGPTESPALQAFRFGKDPYGYLQHCEQRFGDTFTLRLPFEPPRFVTGNPQFIREIFALKPDDYAQSEQSVPANVGERSLLFLDGDNHRKDRQLLMPPLHGERLRSYAHAMQRITAAACARMHPGDVLDIHDVLQNITLEVVLECIFGITDPREQARISAPLFRWLNGVFQPATFAAGNAFTPTRVRRFLDRVIQERRGTRRPAIFPWDGWADAKLEVFDILRAKIEEAKARGEAKGDDVLGLLTFATYDDGSSMEVDAILDQLVTLLVGGHETTANTLSWTLAHVLRDARVLATIKDEIHSVFDGGPIDPTKAALLTYTEATIKESMRLTPIAVSVGRNIAKPLTLGEWSLDAGTIVWPCVALAHRRAESWPEPMAFKPERFVDEPNPATNKFLPFGGGRRTCIGVAFATFEMRIVFAELLWRLDLSIAPGSTIAGEFRGITISPTDAFNLRVGSVRTG